MLPTHDARQPSPDRRSYWAPLTDPTNPRHVQNVRDADATTLLLAHNEYWENAEIFRQVYDRL